MELNIATACAAASFTPTERQAAYQTFCGIIKIDGNIAPQEVQLLNEIRQSMGITDDIIISSRKLDREDIISILKNMDDIKKMILLKFCAMLALSDGVQHPDEIEFVEYIEQVINAPKID